jgi:hypothetical protein
MADAQLKLSRRTLLGAPLLPLILSGAEPAKPALSASKGPVSKDAPALAPVDRHDVSFVVTNWDRALARFHEAQAVLDAARSEPDEDAYDALLDSRSDALCALLALPAPDLAALAAKLEIIVPRLAWELTGAEDCLDRLRRDATRLLARPPHKS